MGCMAQVFFMSKDVAVWWKQEHPEVLVHYWENDDWVEQA